MKAVPRLLARLRSAASEARNRLATLLPGKRPAWVVLHLSGSYPARRPKRKLVSLASLTGAEREQSQEELEERVTSLLAAPWLEGVVLRLGELQLDLARAYAIRNQLLRLRAGGKRVVVSCDDLSTVTYYLATAADEVIAPESATVWVHGMALSTTFMADALARLGVRFEKLAIGEFKNAGDQLALPAMSEAQRLQYDELLDSLEQEYLSETARCRGRTPEEVREWIDRAVTSAVAARELGMIDRVAYEDEYMGDEHRTYAQVAAYLPARSGPPDPGRVAVVSLEGLIVPGRSRRSPLPLPLFGGVMAGSETLVRALRAAAKDPHTAAVVFHVDSGGGSALASDLIWREVKLLAARKPVVAVMGSVAASGGYYVLTHATRIMAAPSTLTGSIGVLMAKFVLEEFNARYGFRPEVLERGEFANVNDSAHSWTYAEQELLRRYNEEIYERFVARVAQGRGLSAQRVDEIGRGRIWSGRAALELGLVDELGDVQLGVARARELAGLHPDAPVWNVHAPRKLVLPVGNDPQALLHALAPLLRERALLMHPFELRVGQA